MAFTPSGKITLISLNNAITKDYRNTRLFTSLTDQRAYFNRQPNRTYNNTQPTRTFDGTVNVDANLESLWQYNYLAYQNETMGDKWFYAFIDTMEYRAPQCTKIYFTIDVMQTWMFDVKLKECFIEREHVGIQNIGDKFFVPENVEYGTGYEVYNTVRVDNFEPDSSAYATLVISNLDLSVDFGDYSKPLTTGAEGGVFNRLPTACNFYIVQPDVYGDASIYDLFQKLRDYPWISKGIVGLTVIPSYMLSGMQINKVAIGGDGSYTMGQIVDDNKPIAQQVYSGNIFTNFPQVRNKKLLMYPYSFLEITCYNGTTLIVQPQFLNGLNLAIDRATLLTFNPEIKYYLGYYQGNGELYDYSITIRDLPQLPVQDSSYLLSAATEKYYGKADVSGNVVDGVLGALGQLISGNFMGAASTAANAFLNTSTTLRKTNVAQAQSPTLAGQIGGSGFNLVYGHLGVTIRWKTISQQNRDILEKYFDMYGYQVNIVKVPDPTKMTRFDFIKTNGCTIVGDCPQNDLQQIISIYDSGITFWHDDDIGNYSGNIGVKK